MNLPARSPRTQYHTMDYLRLFPERVTSHELADALGISEQAARARLFRLWQQGWLTRRRSDWLRDRGSLCEWEYSLLADIEEAA